MDKDERLERLMGILNKRAMMVLALPAEQREAEIIRIESTFIEDARAAGMNVDRAAQWAKDMTGFLRDLIRLIETSGGDASLSSGKAN